MIAPVRSRTRSFLIELPAASQLAGISISSSWMSAPPAIETTSRNAATCGFAIRFAICSPAEEYGWTTRSAPASFSLRAPESSEPRATTKSSGAIAFAESVMKRLISSESADATSPRARRMPARSRSASSVPSPSTTSEPSACAASSASAFTSTTT